MSRSQSHAAQPIGGRCASVPRIWPPSLLWGCLRTSVWSQSCRRRKPRLQRAGPEMDATEGPRPHHVHGPENSDPQPLHDHLEATPRPEGWTSQELAVTAHFSSPPNSGQPTLKSTPQDAWLVSPPTVSMEHRAPSFSSMTKLPPSGPAVGLCPTWGCRGPALFTFLRILFAYSPGHSLLSIKSQCLRTGVQQGERASDPRRHVL